MDNATKSAISKGPNLAISPDDIPREENNLVTEVVNAMTQLSRINSMTQEEAKNVGFETARIIKKS